LNPHADHDPDLACGFAEVASTNARVLVLGSLPGARSIAAGEYYAHPRNTFWRIVSELFGFSATLPYPDRLSALNRSGVALWDVLQASRRPGSLDSAIDMSTARCNDFGAFFASHRHIRLVAFNGRKAAELFRRMVEPQLDYSVPESIVLPSTSPAHAAMSFEEKLHNWRSIRVYCD